MAFIALLRGDMDPYQFGVFLLPGFVVLACLHQLRFRTHIVRQESFPSPSTKSSTHVWLAGEAPLLNPDKDVLETQDRVDRIVSKLLMDQACVLAGPFGSGKTTIFNFASQKLQAKGYLTCTVSTWKIRAENVATHLVDVVLATAAKRYDVLVFRELPSRYRELIRAGSKGIGAVLDVTTFYAPTDLLYRFDALLALTDDRLIIFVEDLDRSSEKLAVDSAMALLDLLKPFKRITYALATNARTEGVDFLKLFDNVELLPPLDHDFTLDQLTSTAVQLWDKFPEDTYFDRPPPPHPYFGATSIFNSYAPNMSRPAAYVAIAQLVDTPRKLKTIIRHVYAAWEELHGEVSLVDLILETTLRVAAPFAWQFMVSNYRELVHVSRDRSDFQGTLAERRMNELQQLRATLLLQLETATQREHINVSPVLVLIAEFFPSWMESQARAIGGDQQRASCAFGDRYFHRLVTRSISSKVKDQEMILAINALSKCGDVRPVSNLFEQDGLESARLLEQFSRGRPYA